MKLKDIGNPTLMKLEELEQLFEEWFPDGVSKEEGWILWSIFSNNNRWLHVPSNKIIETGTLRWFGEFLSGICNEKSNYMDFYLSDYNLETIDMKIIKEIHRIVSPEIELIEDYFFTEENEMIRNALYDQESLVINKE